MPSVRIWTVESDYDAQTVNCLANKLVAYLQLSDLSIQTVGRRALPRGKSVELGKATQNYLKQEDYVIFVIDSDGPMSRHQRSQEPNSLINQIKQVAKDSRFMGKVFLVEAVQELEAWLLVDCFGVFCYFASKRKYYSKNCRERVSKNRSFKRLINRYQKGDTGNIVETESGGKGAKEYLGEFSKRVLLELNSNMPSRNINRERYRENMAPELAEHVVVDQQTLARNNSFRKLGSVLARCKSGVVPN